ncbi:uncharacterized protein LOC129583577 [Paramacrobiotus metropolitanus]|uniref:uncharacterized protein LOC129583577 n=1 Tax=Paramacrobiotus metropolitanus TaxID=2943436 RepID=UPI002445ED6D|nr:uncharacterized protein LOC129583577 [Paramacrobiotus metropolitanus]
MSRRLKNGKASVCSDSNVGSQSTKERGPVHDASVSSDGDRERSIKQLTAVCGECISTLNGSVSDYGRTSLANLKSYYSHQKRLYHRRIIAFIFLCLVLSFGCFWMLLYTQFGGAIFRIFLIKMQPLWDWSNLHDPPCVLENYSMDNEPVSNAHCVICEDLNKLPEREKGRISAFQIGEDFLVEDLPLVIRNGADLKSGPLDLTVKAVLDHHRQDKTLVPCKLRSNLKTKTAFNFDAVLRKVLRTDMDLPWFAFWELCRHHNVREARAVVPRPVELPLMLEVDDSIWFFAARNFTALTAKHVEISTPVFFLSQFVGSSKIRLIPRSPCENICHELETILQPGDFLLFTNELFDFGWMPGNETEVLAVGAGAK